MKSQIFRLNNSELFIIGHADDITNLLIRKYQRILCELALRKRLEKMVRFTIKRNLEPLKAPKLSNNTPNFL